MASNAEQTYNQLNEFFTDREFGGTDVSAVHYIFRVQEDQAKGKNITRKLVQNGGILLGREGHGDLGRQKGL